GAYEVGLFWSFARVKSLVHGGEELLGGPAAVAGEASVEVSLLLGWKLEEHAIVRPGKPVRFGRGVVGVVERHGSLESPQRQASLASEIAQDGVVVASVSSDALGGDERADL